MRKMTTRYKLRQVSIKFKGDALDTTTNAMFCLAAIVDIKNKTMNMPENLHIAPKKVANVSFFQMAITLMY